MGVTSILNIAKNALFAQQTAIQVVSNNVANVNTKGYARQEALLTEERALMTDMGLLTNGVTVSTIMSHYDKYLEASVARQNSSLQEQKTYEQYFGRIESILDEKNSNLTSNITAFFNTWQDLSADPLSTVSRSNVAAAGSNLSSGIRNVYGELQDLRTEMDSNVAQQVQDVNSILHSIAALNSQIYAAGAGGSENNSFVNQRSQLITELSGKMDVQSFLDRDGGMTVMTSGGKPLVDRETVYELSAVMSPTTDVYDIMWQGNSSVSVDITDTIRSGSLKGLIDLRDNQVTGFMASIDGLAHSIISEVNGIHSAGYNMNGTTNVNFFADLNANYAISMDLSTEVRTDVMNIAVTSSATNPSNNDVALAIANLGVGTVSIDGRDTTYIDHTASTSSRIGSLSQNAQNLAEYHENLMTSVEKQRDSVSGVSIDEELSNLIKYQYAYQAAARLINAADTLMTALLEIGR